MRKRELKQSVPRCRQAARSRLTIVFLLVFWACLNSAHAAELQSAQWKYAQDVRVRFAVLQRLELPLATLDAARLNLEDLRVVDPQGHEVPFLVQRLEPSPRRLQDVQTLNVTLQPAVATIVEIKTGLSEPAEGLTITTPAPAFVKAVQVEGSADGSQWELLGKGQPIFRESNAASQLFLPLPTRVWPWLRLTIDDRDSPPVPISGAKIQAATYDPPTQPIAVEVVAREDTPDETRLHVRLAAAHVQLAKLEFDSGDPIFTRPVSVSAPNRTETSAEEISLASGAIYRVAAEGSSASNLTLRVEARIPGRELIIKVRNHDSPPLQEIRVQGRYRPVSLLFPASQIGTYHLLTGNPQCAAPNYDLASMASRLERTPAFAATAGTLVTNTSYRPPEVLPTVDQSGTALDVKDWKYRKPLVIRQSGVQVLELDMQVLAHSAAGFEDPRLIQSGKQVPFLLERTPLPATVPLLAKNDNDPKKPSQSRWALALPEPGLPITQLICSSPTPLFQRQFTLWEEISNERGDTFPRTLGTATWIQRPDQPTNTLQLIIASAPSGQKLFLETENGDNPPIQLTGFQASYPVTRLIFKSSGGDGLFLYYGNRQASYPHYDLVLVAQELQTAEHIPAALGPQQTLKTSLWGEEQPANRTTNAVFWIVLVAVVAVLVTVIVRLLPKTAPPVETKKESTKT